jgi:hypothetical protein
MILADNGSSWFFQGEAASPDAWSAAVTVSGQPAATSDEKLHAFHVGDCTVWVPCCLLRGLQIG